jgi:uncharacterized protein (TIGR03066 family)
MSCLLIVALLLLVPSSGLADDKIDAKLLVGKWQPEKLPDGVEKMTLEFHKGDKVTLDINAQGGNQKLEGTYKVDGNNVNIKMTINGNETDQKRKVTKLTEDELVTKDEAADQERKYKRVK